MSDSPILQIDDDWKRQAQEEKRKLAEREAAARKPAPPPPPPAATAPPAARQQPDASFATLVQSVMTQALFYMGELADEGEQPMFNLDIAKHQIDTLAVIEAKTKGNLTSEEQSLLDAALYDLRSRFVSIATQMIR
ncbi:MAG TPA: DUF1844 domain-containing protein [Tepidisphaeraceae bacterium]|jgi:hypothetical protein